MKILSSVALATLLAAPAFAGSVAPVIVDTIVVTPPPAPSVVGSITAYYGQFAVDSAFDTNHPGGNITLYGLDGSFGSNRSGGFDWQFDIHSETANTDVRGGFVYYTTYGATAHAGYDLGSFTVGGFAGLGVADAVYEGNIADVHWYGVEAAGSFGDFQIAGQVGMASQDNSHSGLNYTDYSFGSVEARYFVNDNMMFTANSGLSTGSIHGDDLTMLNYGADGTIRLGQSDFYATLGYRAIDADAPGAGSAKEHVITFGVSMLFGGSLREVYGANAMINNSMQTYTSIMTGTLD